MPTTHETTPRQRYLSKPAEPGFDPENIPPPGRCPIAIGPGRCGVTGHPIPALHWQPPCDEKGEPRYRFDRSQWPSLPETHPLAAFAGLGAHCTGRNGGGGTFDADGLGLDAKALAKLDAPGFPGGLVWVWHATAEALKEDDGHGGRSCRAAIRRLLLRHFSGEWGNMGTLADAPVPTAEQAPFLPVLPRPYLNRAVAGGSPGVLLSEYEPAPRRMVPNEHGKPIPDPRYSPESIRVASFHYPGIACPITVAVGTGAALAGLGLPAR